MPAEWWSFKRVVMSPVILFYYFSVLLLYYHTTVANTESIDDVHVSVLCCVKICVKINVRCWILMISV